MRKSHTFNFHFPQETQHFFDESHRQQITSKLQRTPGNFLTLRLRTMDAIQLIGNRLEGESTIKHSRRINNKIVEYNWCEEREELFSIPVLKVNSPKLAIVGERSANDHRRHSDIDILH